MENEIKATCGTCDYMVHEMGAYLCHGVPPVAMLIPDVNPLSRQQGVRLEGFWAPTNPKNRACSVYKLNIQVKES